MARKTTTSLKAVPAVWVSTSPCLPKRLKRNITNDIKYKAETFFVSALYLYKGLRLTQSCGSFLDHFFCTEDDVLDNCCSRFNLLDKSGTFAGHVAAVDVAFLYSLA